MIDPRGESTRVSLLNNLADRTKQDAWLAFDRRYGDLITRYACRCGLSFADADDARQVTFVILLSVMEKFEYDRSRGCFRSYLAMVVRRAIGRCRDKRSETSFSISDIDVPVSAERSDSVWDEEWERMMLQSAIAHVRTLVSPESIDVFEDLMRGLSVAAICGSRDISRDAVYKIRSRVGERLAAEIRATDHGEKAIIRKMSHAP